MNVVANNLVFRVLSCVLACVSFQLNAQKLEVVATAGNYVENGSVTINWTVGEPVIKTIGNQTHFLTQGFNQMQWITIGEYYHIPTQLNASVYPNPMSRDLTLDFPGVENLRTKYRVMVFDLLYKPVFESEIESELSNFDLSHLRNATYVIHLVDEEGRFLKSFRVIKNM